MARSFQQYPELVSGFSEARDGTMTLNGAFDNRRRYLAERGLRPERTVHAYLFHGKDTIIVSGEDGGRIVPATDGLITAEVNLGLAMTGADCLLVSVYDPRLHIIGLVHAGGWGLGQQAITEFLRTWTGAFPTKPEGLVVSISPSICRQHFTVKPDEAAPFRPWPEACQQIDNLVHIDLRRIALAQLTGGGIPSSQIEISPICTFEQASYFSYRRDHPPTPQLQAGYIIRGA